MTETGKDDSRRSRWIWEKDDIIIIKKEDGQPQAGVDQTKGETPVDDKANSGIAAQGEESKEG